MVGLKTVDEAVIWHDVECASYDADLDLWRALADEHPGELLDIGCGTGRVALDLAALGHDVTGLDSDPALLAALAARARARGLRVRTTVADARSFDLGRRVALAIAPMQVVQLLGGESGRIWRRAASSPPRWPTRSTIYPRSSRCRRCPMCARRVAGCSRARRWRCVQRATARR